MSATWARRLLVLALLVWLVLLVADIMLLVLTWGAEIPGTTTENTRPVADLIAFGAAFVAYPVVGAIVIRRHPSHTIGWLFVFAGIVLVASGLTPLYLYEGRYVEPGSLPGPIWAAWASGWLDPLFFATLALILLLFPDGRPPSARWRPLVWVTVGAIVGGVVQNALKPGQIRNELPVSNPLGLESFGDGVFTVVGTLVNLLLLASVVGAVVAVVWRFRHAEGLVRQQIKWIVYVAIGFVVVLLISFVVAVAGFNGGELAVIGIGLAFAGVPVAAGLAILRYRLYDVDRVISRTLGYALVTIVLGAVYAGLVLVGQALFSSFAGGSNLAIAASTLVVAALFLPARSRVQHFVDRRFYRRRYDAQRTLEAFGTRLREQVDLGTLSGDLRTAVDETMQPAHVSVWLRGPG